MQRPGTSPQEGTWRTGPLLPALAETTSLEIYDVRGVEPDARLSISTLVGLVNRGPAKIYLLESGDDEFWLTKLDPALPRTVGSVSGDALLDHLLNIHRAQVRGLVLYDPALPDTRNVATTLAGLRDGLVVSPAQASRLQAAPFALPILADLRVHGWKTRVQVYAWAYKTLLPECSAELVAGLAPAHAGGLRSFLVAHRVFTCWLDTRRRQLLTCPCRLSERHLFKRILSHFAPAALHLGWFSDEPSAIRLASRAALLTFASDHCTNLEIWSTLPQKKMASTEHEALRVQAAGHERPGESVKGRDERETTYLSFTLSEGDNLQYCQHRLLHLWQDPARGTVPIGWTIAPALLEVMPELAAFYRGTLTENDEFIAGPSGAAYVLPSLLPGEQRVPFLQDTARSMRAMGLSLVQVLDNGGRFSMRFLNPSLQREFARQLAPSGLRGILSGAGGLIPSWHQAAGVPIYQNLGLATNPQRTLSLIRQTAARGTRFINVYIFAWNMTPSDLQAIVQQLGDGFTSVTPGRLLELIRQEGKERGAPGRPSLLKDGD